MQNNVRGNKIGGKSRNFFFGDEIWNFFGGGVWIECLSSRFLDMGIEEIRGRGWRG